MRKRNLGKIFVALTLVGTVFLFSCDIDRPSHTFEENVRPVPGEIVVAFVDGTDQWFVESFLDTIDVEILEETFGYRAFMKVDSGAAWYYKDKILDMQNVTSVWIVYGSEGEKDFLDVTFNGMVDTTYAYRVAGRFKYLSVTKIIPFVPSVLLRVDIGTENEWIAKFEEYPFVLYAEQKTEYY